MFYGQLFQYVCDKRGEKRNLRDLRIILLYIEKDIRIFYKEYHRSNSYTIERHIESKYFSFKKLTNKSSLKSVQSKFDKIDSESPRNENPRNNPKAPPTSAIKDIFGYNQTSSLIDILVLE